MKRFYLPTCSGLIFLLCNIGWAEQFQIGFEDLPTSGEFNIPLDHYLDQGVLFYTGSGLGLRGASSTPGWFEPIEGEVSLWVPYISGLPQTIDMMFYVPGTTTQQVATDVSFYVGHLWHTYYVSTLDADRNILSSLTVSGTSDPDWRRYSFDSPFYGTRVEVSSYDSFAIDDLQYSLVPEPAVIPVPSAVILGSIGLAFSGWKLRRRRKL